MITLQPNWKATTSAELPVTKPKQMDVEEVLRTLEKLYNDFTMRRDEERALDWAIRFIKEHTEEGAVVQNECYSNQYGYAKQLLRMPIENPMRVGNGEWLAWK